jgi:hypothetical protein
MLMRIAIVLLACVVLGGCSGSRWEQEFTPTAAVEPLPGNVPVRVREVDWDRLQSGLDSMRQEAAASDVPESEWTQDKRDAAKARLLRTLQVSADPMSVEVVGRSEFRTTDSLRPDRDGQLAELAKKVGATEVVWSRRHLGKADTIIEEPVNSYSTVNEWGGRRGRDRSYSESTTTWVPVVVAADEFAYVAYFLRR